MLRNSMRFFSNAAKQLPSLLLVPLNLSNSPSFLKLVKYHQQGKLKLHQIISPPRTGSTSLFRALAQAREISFQDNLSGAIFEPFLNRKAVSYEEKLEHGARIILDRAKLLGVEHQPVTLLMKEIASYLPVQLMQHWQEIVSNFIFLIEDPHKQLFSFLQMLANGRTFGLKDANGNPLLNNKNEIVMHSDIQMRALWPAVTEMLAKKQFQQSGWKYIFELVNMVNQHCQQFTDKKMVVVDGSIVKLSPETTLVNLCNKLNDFTYTQEMISCWDRTRGQLFFHPNAPSYDPVGLNGESHSLWTGPARRATMFALPAISYGMDAFPDKLAKHILQEALPVYNALLHDPNFVLPNNLDDLIEKGSATCPVSLAGVLKVLIDKTNQTSQPDMQLLSYYKKIVREHPEFSTAFIAMANNSLENRGQACVVAPRCANR